MKYQKLKLNNDQINFFYGTLDSFGVISVPKIGVFKIKRIKPRRFYHNFSDKQIVVSGRNKLSFRPFNKVKEKIQSLKLNNQI